MQLAIKNANEALEAKIDGKLDAVKKDLHGRADRMEKAQNKSNQDIAEEIKAGNANTTQELKAITQNTIDILLQQKDTNNTAEQLALKIKENEKDIDGNNKSIKGIWKAVGTVGAILLTAFLGWLSTLSRTPPP